MNRAFLNPDGVNALFDLARELHDDAGSNLEPLVAETCMRAADAILEAMNLRLVPE